MEIKGFIETSLIDWDGKIASVIFLPGCNFRCPFCHNSQLVQKPDELATVEWESVVAQLSRHRGWIDGVVVTGGEPTIHPELPSLLRAVKEMGLATKLDTNGYLPEVLRHLIDGRLVDYVAMDIKAAPDERYSRAAGVKVNLKLIEASVALLMASGVDYEFRTTVVPLFMKKSDVREIGKAVKGARKWALQQFKPLHSAQDQLQRIWPYADEILLAMRDEGAQWVECCEVRGMDTVG